MGQREWSEAQPAGHRALASQPLATTLPALRCLHSVDAAGPPVLAWRHANLHWRTRSTWERAKRRTRWRRSWDTSRVLGTVPLEGCSNAQSLMARRISGFSRKSRKLAALVEMWPAADWAGFAAAPSSSCASCTRPSSAADPFPAQTHEPRRQASCRLLAGGPTQGGRPPCRSQSRTGGDPRRPLLLCAGISSGACGAAELSAATCRSGFSSGAW